MCRLFENKEDGNRTVGRPSPVDRTVEVASNSGTGLDSSVSIPAAEYLRTSTAQQPYSIDAQKQLIRQYASGKGFAIVRTYVDVGRSGLTLKHRPGLSSLLHDVAFGTCNFRAVLVYDVSRWGRFQDADESAHYEYLCRAMNVEVHYCAESFFNDQAMPAFILKSLKRTMAAEYSCELSYKCFRGQKLLAESGFRMGGRSGYGLQRMSVSEDGQGKEALRPGEYKSLSSHHIILVPGPAKEVEIVRLIFALALEGLGSYSEIARELNRRGFRYRSGLRWPDHAIVRILRNKKYAGWYIWNRYSGKLGTNRTRNPSDRWVLVPKAFSPIVDPETFDEVQKVFPPGPRWTQDQVLERAEALASQPFAFSNEGPSITTLRRRVVGLRCLRSSRGTRRQERAGIVLSMRQQLLNFRNDIFDELLERFPGQLTEFHLPRKSRPMLQLANGMVVSVVVCGRQSRRTGILRWMLRPAPGESKFVTLICLNAPDRLRYYLVPGVDVRRDCLIGTDSALFKTGIRLKDLQEFYDAASAFLKSGNRSWVRRDSPCL